MPLTLKITDEFATEDEAMDALDHVVEQVKKGFTSGYYPGWSVDIEVKDGEVSARVVEDTETLYAYEPSEYTARFNPQVWHNDYAVESDPEEGPNTWVVSKAHIDSLREHYGDGWMEADQYESDEIRDDPHAPEWIREWDGPFFVEVWETDSVVDS